MTTKRIIINRVVACLAVVAFMTIPVALWAAGGNCVWQPSSHTNFNNASAWSCGRVPGDTDTVLWTHSNAYNCSMLTNVKVYRCSSTTAWTGALYQAPGTVCTTATTVWLKTGGQLQTGGTFVITGDGHFYDSCPSHVSSLLNTNRIVMMGTGNYAPMVPWRSRHNLTCAYPGKTTTIKQALNFRRPSTGAMPVLILNGGTLVVDGYMRFASQGNTGGVFIKDNGNTTIIGKNKRVDFYATTAAFDTVSMESLDFDSCVIYVPYDIGGGSVRSRLYFANNFTTARTIRITTDSVTSYADSRRVYIINGATVRCDSFVYMSSDVIDTVNLHLGNGTVKCRTFLGLGKGFDTLYMQTGTIECTRNFICHKPVINAGTSTLKFIDSTGTFYAKSSNTALYYDVEKNGAGTRIDSSGIRCSDDLTVNASGGSLVLTKNVNIGDKLTVTAGTLDASGDTVIIGGDAEYGSGATVTGNAATLFRYDKDGVLIKTGGISLPVSQLTGSAYITQGGTFARLRFPTSGIDTCKFERRKRYTFTACDSVDWSRNSGLYYLLSDSATIRDTIDLPGTRGFKRLAMRDQVFLDTVYCRRADSCRSLGGNY